MLDLVTQNEDYSQSNVLDIQITEEFLPLFDEEHSSYNCRHKAWYGGRGSLKSWTIARGLLIRGIKNKERILCAREFQNSITESVLRLLEDQIELLGLQNFYEVKRNGIFGTNGTEFIFKGLKRNIQSIKSIEGITIVWIEEAQVVSKESWDILRPTIRKKGSQILVSFNPNLATDETYVRYVTVPPKNSYVCEVNYDQNPFFYETELVEEMEYDREHDQEKYQHVWRGKPVQHVKALVFSKWKIDGSIEPKEDETLYFGADWGFSNDPSVLLRCWADHGERIIYIDYEVYKVGVEIDHLPELFDKVPGSRKWRITADSARPETISYLNRNGFKVKGTKKGKGSVDEGIEFLKSYTIVVHTRCIRLIAELGLYKYKVDSMTEEVLPILVDKHNHCIDSLRYAFEKLAFKRLSFNIG